MGIVRSRMGTWTLLSEHRCITSAVRGHYTGAQRGGYPLQRRKLALFPRGVVMIAASARDNSRQLTNRCSSANLHFFSRAAVTTEASAKESRRKLANL